MESTWDHITERVKARRERQDGESEISGTGKSSPAVEIEREEQVTCGVGVAGVDIDPYGNVQACMHLQESAGNLHRQSIKEIWEHSPLFQRARSRAITAAQQFADKSPRQLGAPLYCIAVEENCNKPCDKCT